MSRRLCEQATDAIAFSALCSFLSLLDKHKPFSFFSPLELPFAADLDVLSCMNDVSIE